MKQYMLNASWTTLILVYSKKVNEKTKLIFLNVKLNHLNKMFRSFKNKKEKKVIS